MEIAIPRREKALVGLDIQSCSVTAVQVDPESGKTKRIASSSLPSGLVREGEFLDQAALGSALKLFFAEHKLDRHVRLGLANQRVVVRVFDIPPIDQLDERDTAVRFKASELLPMPLDEAVLDYQVVERFSTGSNGNEMDRVVLVAAPLELVDRMVAAMKSAGLKLEGIDLAAFALIRALHQASSNGDGQLDDADDEAVAYCHLGSMTSLAVAHGVTCLFARTMSYGIGPIVDGSVPLESGAIRIADEIQASLDYYASQQAALPVRQTLVTGEGALIDGLVEAVAQHIPSVITPAAPAITDSNGVPSERLALAYGLALSEVLQ